MTPHCGLLPLFCIVFLPQKDTIPGHLHTHLQNQDSKWQNLHLESQNLANPAVLLWNLHMLAQSQDMHAHYISLVRFNYYPEQKLLKKLAKHGCKHVSFDTRCWSFLEINPPLKQQMALCVPGAHSTHEELGDWWTYEWLALHKP